MGGGTEQPNGVVVAGGRAASDSRGIEIIGNDNPRTEPVELSIDADKAKAWIAKGAQPSDTGARLLRTSGILPAAKK